MEEVVKHGLSQEQLKEQNGRVIIAVASLIRECLGIDTFTIRAVKLFDFEQSQCLALGAITSELRRIKSACTYIFTDRVKQRKVVEAFSSYFDVTMKDFMTLNVLEYHGEN